MTVTWPAVPPQFGGGPPARRTAMRSGQEDRAAAGAGRDIIGSAVEGVPYANLGSCRRRHLLTHTAGIGYWRRMSDCGGPVSAPEHGAVGAGARGLLPSRAARRGGAGHQVGVHQPWFRRPRPDRRRRHRHGVRRTCAPGLRPLGMDHTDLVRSRTGQPVPCPRVRAGPHGLTPVADYAVPTAAGCGAYSTPADLEGYMAALLQGGTNDHGSVLEPETVASMFEAHHLLILGWQAWDWASSSARRVVTRPSARAASCRLPVCDPPRARRRAGPRGPREHRTSRRARCARAGRRGAAAPRPLATPEDVRPDIPPHAEGWHQFCGWYGPSRARSRTCSPERCSAPGSRWPCGEAAWCSQPLTPVASMRQGVPLHPDDPDDARVFRAEFPDFGKSFRVVFIGEGNGGAPAAGLLIDLGVASPATGRHQSENLVRRCSDRHRRHCRRTRGAASATNMSRAAQPLAAVGPCPHRSPRRREPAGGPESPTRPRG